MTNEDNNIENHNFDILKKNIERLRKENGWSQYELGKKIAIEQSNISKCLSGDRCFTLEQVWRLADLFGTSVDELLGRDTTSEKISVNNLCKFLAELIQRKILVPYEIHVDEQIDIETGLEFGDEPEYKLK